MTQHTFIIVMIVIPFMITVIWGSCIWLLFRIRKENTARKQLEKSNTCYEMSAKLYSDFRVIRHDFANYVQAACALEDEESRALIKKQKMDLRKIITEWNNEADAFTKSMKGQDGIHNDQYIDN